MKPKKGTWAPKVAKDPVFDGLFVDFRDMVQNLKPPPTPEIDIRDLVRRLFDAAERMHVEYERLREALAVLSGTDISGWTYEDMERYMNVAIDHYKEHYGQDH